ncbi:glycine betaine ABC transporter substrate-binding protein [Pseudogracilibacillus auburnensis]|uniref:Glycine betaine/proline transport system substrate-binding protein n=1 Tax=Pseudogracilibacillus auburnensis TaxID=1494959 RepID=A0A2V3VLC8_9BACI|nr:glycine betaine ABC transporter substrate-binding protein [Pseudogracilibacillus auburnensis]PXW82613.1 glycine betaine/proline transport system substrate-binding protein [Pseudogracilibacillus auburnensis]
MRFKYLMIIVLSFSVLISACGGKKEDETKDTDVRVIEMGQINWAENIAVSNMWKVILEDKGYEVNFNVLDIGTTMAALANNELDVGLEVWLPVQDANYLEQYKEEIHFSDETWYDNAKVGLVVPSYVEEVNSIEDLNDYQALFESVIVGFDPGAGTMEVTEDLIAAYDLHYELLPSSEPAMVTEIKEAIDQGDPIVAPLWSPHRIFSEVDLKYLEDPKEVYGGVEKIHHATRHGFAEDFPEVDRWLKNWKMDDDQIGALMSYVADADDPIEGAKQWVEENEDTINEWLD